MVSRRRAVRLAAAIAMIAMLSACAVLSPDSSTNTGVAIPLVMAAPFHSDAHPPAIRDLAGLKPDEILSILGKPDLKRNEPPAELWQYRTADCVLNLFFYDDAGGYRLAHAESWQRTLSASSVPAHCRDDDAPIKAHLISQSQL